MNIYHPCLQVYDGQEGLALHPDSGFTNSDLPDFPLSAESGELQLRFRTNQAKSKVVIPEAGWSAVFRLVFFFFLHISFVGHEPLK